jgi:nickel transport protein
MFFLVLVSPARAHKVTVFAWVEGDVVYTESRFNDGKPVKDGMVVVYDSEGNQLIQGKTDREGTFSFAVPKRGDLDIMLQAGMGHRAQWRVSAEEFEGPLPRELAAETRRQTDDADSEQTEQPLQGLSPEEIESVVERALDRKLKPVNKMLAESRDTRPSFRDIVGGIGYILGLVGVGSYFYYRRTSKRAPKQ